MNKILSRSYFVKPGTQIRWSHWSSQGALFIREEHGAGLRSIDLLQVPSKKYPKSPGAFFGLLDKAKKLAAEVA